MMTAFMEGGWGMWPTLAIGLVAEAMALRYALRVRRELNLAVLALGTATLLSGLLGTVSGLIRTFHYVSELPVEKQITVAFIGVAESLHNVALALMLTAFAALTVAVGLYRRRVSPSEFAP